MTLNNVTIFINDFQYSKYQLEKGLKSFSSYLYKNIQIDKEDIDKKD